MKSLWVLVLLTTLGCAGVDDGGSSVDPETTASPGSDVTPTGTAPLVMVSPSNQPQPTEDAPVAGSACDVSAPANVNASGVLTAFPQITTTIFPSTFSLLSVHFVVTEDGDERGPLLSMFAELRNDGLDLQCNFIPDITLNGIELIGLVDTPPYREQSDFVDITTLTDCLDTGEVGVLLAVQRGVSREALSGPGSLYIDAAPLNLTVTEFLPAPDVPLVSPQIRQTPEGWALGGTVTPAADLWNYGLYVYARDARGLLFSRLVAFPGDLDALYAGTPAEFETDSTPCTFSDYTLVQTWISGSP